MARARSVSEVLNMKKTVFSFDEDWFKAFGRPETCGVWFIWGNSGSGKTSFTMQLCKYLCRFGRVAYDSLEEGASLTMQNTLRRFGMEEVNRRFVLLDNEPIGELSERLKKQKAPDIMVIDSFQYTQMSYRQYISLKEQHPDKLLIFISHAEGKKPATRAAVSVMFDASLKIYVEGYRAFTRGRFIGPRGHYDIWPEKAEEYWGNRNTKSIEL